MSSTSIQRRLRQVAPPIVGSVIWLGFAELAHATCAVPAGGATVGTFSATNTNNATENYSSFALGSFGAGTTLIVGTTGLIGASNSGDTFIRLHDDSSEVASNNDACGISGSRVVYTVPQGLRRFTLRVGCAGNGSCSGQIMLWTRVDSNGSLSDITRAYHAVVADDANKIATVNLRNDVGPEVTAYIGGGNDLSHYQGVQRLRGGNSSWVAVSGSNRADIMFGSPGCIANSSASQAWKERGVRPCDGSMRYRASLHRGICGTPRDHVGGIQVSGNYLVAGITNYPATDYLSAIMLLDVSDVSATAEKMKKWEFLTTCGGISNLAITKHQDGSFLLMVTRKDETIADFYVKSADEYTTILSKPLAQPLAAPDGSHAGFADIESQEGWRLEASAVAVPPNSNVNLFTQVDGSIFLLGTRWMDGGNTAFIGRLDNRMKAFLGGFPPQRAGFTCAGASFCNFDGAAGFYADAISDRLYLYTTSKFMSKVTRSVGLVEMGSSLPPRW